MKEIQIWFVEPERAKVFAGMGEEIKLFRDVYEDLKTRRWAMDKPERTLILYSADLQGQ